MKDTRIGWTDHTFNIAWGCVKVGPGCLNCYAKTLAARWGWDIWGPKKPRRVLGPAYWKQPLKWNADAAKLGPPVINPKAEYFNLPVEERSTHLVFCSSMCDVFEQHDVLDAERLKLWPLIRATPNLVWQLLTKRPERILGNLPPDWGNGYPNVWIGTSIENNDYVGRADFLRQVPARVRFISYEPALGPLDKLNLEGLSWVIYGGESGPGFRHEGTPENPKIWATDMKRRCDEAGVAFFHKQSANLYTERGIELAGELVHDYPTPVKLTISAAAAEPRKQLSPKLDPVHLISGDSEPIAGKTVVDRIIQASTPEQTAAANTLLKRFASQRAMTSGNDPKWIEAGIKARVTRLKNASQLGHPGRTSACPHCGGLLQTA